MFPFVASGSVTIRGAGFSDREFVARLVKGLRVLSPEELTVTGSAIGFRGGTAAFKSRFLSLERGLFLVSITSGTLSVAEREGALVVGYRVTFWLVVFFGTLLATIGPAVVGHRDPKLEILAYVVGWLWLVCANYVVAVVRLRHFVRRTPAV